MKKAKWISAMLLAVVLLTACGHISDKASDAQGSAVAADARMRERVSLSGSEKSLLAWLVACEAGDRPYMAQVCVASVILNRLEDESCDLRELIFEEGDFLSVLNGHVRGEPTEAERKTKKYTVGKMALDEALSGHDPTGGALYYADSDDSGARIAIGYECGGLIFGN